MIEVIQADDLKSYHYVTLNGKDVAYVLNGCWYTRSIGWQLLSSEEQSQVDEHMRRVLPVIRVTERLTS